MSEHDDGGAVTYHNHSAATMGLVLICLTSATSEGAGEPRFIKAEVLYELYRDQVGEKNEDRIVAFTTACCELVESGFLRLHAYREFKICGEVRVTDGPEPGDD